MAAPFAQSAVDQIGGTNAALLRGVSADDILHNFASVMSNKAGSEDHYALSEQVEFLDAFLSHTWSTSRLQKFMALVFHYNLAFALAISLVTSGAACLLTAHGFLPSVTVVGLMTDVDRHVHRGVLCMPLGLLAFLISLFTLHELRRYCTPGKKERLFLDKCSIHQTDSELKRKGIESLADFLQCSRELYVLYNDNYLQRLWTTYEIAAWLVLRRGEPITVRPVFAPGALLGGCFASTLGPTTWLIAAALKSSTPQLLHFQVLWSALSMAIAICIYCCVALLGSAWAEDLERIETHVANFRLANARCVCEADRDVVIRNIAAFMRSARLAEASTPGGEVMEKFEELVRREVPGLIGGSLGRVGIPYSWVLVVTLPNVLTSLDWASGWPLDGRSGWFIFWFGLREVFLVLVILPFVNATVISNCRAFPALRRPWRCLLHGVMAFLGSYIFFQLSNFLTARGIAQNQLLLVALMPIYGLVLVATITMFRTSPEKKSRAPLV